ncbi:hypothetical protein VKT23_008530 [Stygiomarasmius scandens]|uniref:F-box domain-containing protein n=1 Tax=Marasmiellus scandens TaxID=2682957 RepID=A0ABR1JJZ5_9AGAR
MYNQVIMSFNGKNQVSIHSLPIELLTEIFEWHCDSCGLLATDTFSKDTEKDEFIVETPALDLSQTCVLWRDLAKSMYPLWTCMTISLTHDKMSLLKLVDTYLAYSLSAPLSLILDAWEPGGESFATSFSACGSAIFKSLLKHADRWQKVELEMSFSVFRDLDISSVYIPRLVALEELLIPDESEDPDGVEMSQFRQLFGYGLCPRLHKLSIADSFSSRIVNCLPCFQLVVIYIHGSYMDCDVVCQLLRHCPNLQHLYIKPDFDDEEPGHPSPSLVECTVLNLMIVSLGERDDKNPCSGMIACTKVFYSITAPSLATLRLTGDKDPESTDHQLKLCFDSIRSFFQHSGSQLQSLELAGDFITTEVLLELLQRLPNLIQFFTVRAHKRLGLLEALTIGDRPGNGPVLLPKLIELGLGISLTCEDILISRDVETLENDKIHVVDKDEGLGEECIDIRKEEDVVMVQDSATNPSDCSEGGGIETRHQPLGRAGETKEEDVRMQEAKGNEEMPSCNESKGTGSQSQATESTSDDGKSEPIITEVENDTLGTEEIAQDKANGHDKVEMAQKDSNTGSEKDEELPGCSESKGAVEILPQSEGVVVNNRDGQSEVKGVAARTHEILQDRVDGNGDREMGQSAETKKAEEVSGCDENEGTQLKSVESMDGNHDFKGGQEPIITKVEDLKEWIVVDEASKSDGDEESKDSTPENQNGTLTERRSSEGLIDDRGCNELGTNSETSVKIIPELSKEAAAEPRNDDLRVDSVKDTVDKICNMIQSRRDPFASQTPLHSISKFNALILSIKVKTDSEYEQRWARRFSSDVRPRLENLLGRDGYVLKLDM